jgi:citrate synthase
MVEVKAQKFIASTDGDKHHYISMKDALVNLEGALPVDDTFSGSVYPTQVSSINSLTSTLLYRGYEISDLLRKNVSYEEVIYLLLHGELPAPDELKVIKAELAEKIAIDPFVQAGLKTIIGTMDAKTTDPMAMMSTAVAYMNACESLPQKTEEERYTSSLREIAVMPTLLGLVNAHLKGTLKDFTFPKPDDFGNRGGDYSVARQTLQALGGGEVTQDRLAIMDTYLTLHAEHGFNLSTSVGRAVGSGETATGQWRVTLGAMQALAGDRHGNASVNALNNLKNIQEKYKGTPEEKVAAFIANWELQRDAAKENGGKKPAISGFGHAVYQHGADPRAKAFEGVLNTHASESELLQIAQALEKRLADHPDFGKKAGRAIAPNVDFYSGVVLENVLGIDERLMTSMFAVGRTVGWQAHHAEHARSHGIIRNTNTLYVGEEEREVSLLSKRTPPTQLNGASAMLPFPRPTTLTRAA